MTEFAPGVSLNFTYRCQTCAATVQVENAVDNHPHQPTVPPLVIEGCNASTDLATRVEQALDDYDVLTATERTDR